VRPNLPPPPPPTLSQRIAVSVSETLESRFPGQEDAAESCYQTGGTTWFCNLLVQGSFDIAHAGVTVTVDGSHYYVGVVKCTSGTNPDGTCVGIDQ